MALIARLSRLLRADLHAVLDDLEEPHALLRQAVREMEEALAADQARMRRMRRDHGALARRSHELEQALAAVDAELDLCFEAGEEDLARALCRRKLETAQLADATTHRRDALERELGALEQRVREQQLCFESARQKAELFAADDDTTPADRERAGAGIAVDDVEVAFLREQRKRRAS